MTGHLLLIDASGIAFRAFATSDPVHRESDGEPIGATLRFMEIAWRMRGAAEIDNPTHGCAVFDIPGPNFRHYLYPAYKSNRDPARRLILDGQLPFMKHAAQALGLYPVEAEGFEADDVIATLARKFVAAGGRVTIVSSDKDFGQLVKDGEIEIVDPMQSKRVGEKEVVDKWGVAPRWVTHVQALAGDSADGYPGIQHCGLKRASGLIRAYRSIDGVFENVSKVPYPALKRSLKAAGAYDKVTIFHKLAKLRTDVPVNPNIWTLCAIQPVLKSHLEAILKSLGAPAWAMQSVFGLETSNIRLVPVLEKPLVQMEWWKQAVKFGVTGMLPDIPQVGFYKRTLVRFGPEVPARIWREPSRQDGMDWLKCQVDGKDRDPFQEWPRLSMKPISAREYEALSEKIVASRAKGLDPRKPLPDISKQPKSTNPRRRA